MPYRDYGVPVQGDPVPLNDTEQTSLAWLQTVENAQQIAIRQRTLWRYVFRCPDGKYGVCTAKQLAHRNSGYVVAVRPDGALFLPDFLERTHQ